MSDTCKVQSQLKRIAEEVEEWASCWWSVAGRLSQKTPIIRRSTALNFLDTFILGIPAQARAQRRLRDD